MYDELKMQKFNEINWKYNYRKKTSRRNYCVKHDKWERKNNSHICIKTSKNTFNILKFNI